MRLLPWLSRAFLLLCSSMIPTQVSLPFTSMGRTLKRKLKGLNIFEHLHKLQNHIHTVRAAIAQKPLGTRSFVHFALYWCQYSLFLGTQILSEHNPNSITVYRILFLAEDDLKLNDRTLTSTTWVDISPGCRPTTLSAWMLILLTWLQASCNRNILEHLRTSQDFVWKSQCIDKSQE